MAAAAREGRQAARRPRDEAEELALLLVRDWLERSAFHSTVQAFDIESVRLDRPAPPRSKREALLELLQHAVPDADRHATVPILRALLESLLAQSLGFSKKLTAPPQPPRQQTTILMSKKKAVDADLRVVKKSTLSRARGAASTPQFTTQPSPNNRPDSGFRPKSAVTCRSTPELVSLSGSQPGVKRPLRPISAASTLPHRTNPSDSPYNIQPGSPTQLGAVPETPETRSPKLDKSISRATSLRVINGPSTRHFSNIAIAPLPQITETNITIGADESDDEKPKETEPALLLEEMSEELLMSQYSSLSKEAIKTIRRVRAKSNAYNQEFVKSKRTIGKIQAREKQRQLRRVIAAEQTELLSSAMDGLTKEPCGLCEFVFPKKSLIMKVTYKAIFDLRAKWSAAASSPSGEVHLRSLPLSGSNRKRPGSDSGDEREEAGDAGDRSQIAHYYDEVPICVFCKQLVLDVSFYRVHFPMFFFCFIVCCH